MKASAIRELSVDEIRHQLDDAREKYFKARFQLATGQLKNTAALRQVRREIARLATVLHEREKEQA
ncbi:MAG: ribosomal protein L29 [Anaerolineales bacterium]|jgi:large subunit ribosomal protein L29|nr:ribosomal protein L29 [Anaerolineales bacterium]